MEFSVVADTVEMWFKQQACVATQRPVDNESVIHLTANKQGENLMNLSQEKKTSAKQHPGVDFTIKK